MIKIGQIRIKSRNIESSHFLKKKNRQANNRKFKIRKTRERIAYGKLFLSGREQMEKNGK